MKTVHNSFAMADKEGRSKFMSNAASLSPT